MELSKDLIGKTFGPFSYEVERYKIKEFAMAIGDSNPIFFDREEAIKQGYKDTPAPLTFPTVFVMWGYGFEKLFQELEKVGVDTGRLLHLKEEYEYHRPIYPGDRITGTIKITDVKTGKMNMVVFETPYTDQNQEPVVLARMTIVILPQEASS